jgi:hypothetical protein
LSDKVYEMYSRRKLEMKAFFCQIENNIASFSPYRHFRGGVGL